MATAGLDYQRETFAFIDRLDRLSSMDAMMSEMQRVLATFGLEYCAFQDLPDTKRSYDEFVICTRVPEEWLKIYLKEEYVRIDPAFRLCRRSIDPFIWADAPYDAEREPRTVEFLRRVADFGLSRGFVIPVPRQAGGLGVVWFGGINPELNARSKTSLHLLALYTFERLRLLHTPSHQEKPLLTSREREVLTWAAQGKSAWEIGEILNIAKRTVDEHIQSTFRKLGAKNRTQAVAIALRDRLISL